MNATTPTKPDEAASDPGSAAREGRFHTYVGARIPWYVRLMWLGFWVFAAVYVIRYLFPALQVEISSPP
jgi:hypothetical protein